MVLIGPGLWPYSRGPPSLSSIAPMDDDSNLTHRIAYQHLNDVRRYLSVIFTHVTLSAAQLCD